MLHRILPLAALACSASLASAQNTAHLVEDFDNGATDWFPHGLVQMWHISAPSECGLPGGWASSTLAQNPCRYGSPGWAWSSRLSSPDFVPGGGPLELRFESRLELEAGDHALVSLVPLSTSGLPSLVLTTELDLTNDGQTESIVAWAPGADLYAGLACHLLFEVRHDGAGDLGLGWAIDEVRLIETPVARPFCLADGVPLNCPCGNLGDRGEGCRNSSGSGASLTGFGSARVDRDDLQLRLAGGPAGQPALLFRGTASTPAPFGDGLLCCGAPQRRVAPLWIGPGGRAETPATVGSAAGALPGDRHHYQVWYRDPGGSCGQGSNQSSGVVVDWL